MSEWFDAIGLSKLQYGFDTATFISIVGSTTLLFLGYHRRKKSERNERFVEGARASVIEALNREAKDFAIGQAGLQAVTYRLSSSGAGLTERHPYYLQMEMDETAFMLWDDDAEREYVESAKKIGRGDRARISAFLQISEEWDIEFRALTRRIKSSQRILAPYWRLAYSAAMPSPPSSTALSKDNLPNLVGDVEERSRDFTDFRELMALFFEVYCMALDKGNSDQSRRAFEWDIVNMMKNRLSHHQARSLIEYPSDALQKEYDEEVQCARDLDEWERDVLKERCEEMVNNPWEFFSLWARVLVTGAEEAVETKLEAMSEIHSELITTFLLQQAQVASKKGGSKATS